MANTYNTLSSLFTAIANAIRTKTGDSSEIVADNFPTAIAAIPSGGSIVEESDVNFIDHDGTLVASYTAAEFAELEVLPSNPSHDGLTAQGWNWTLADAKTYVASYGKLWVGQNYVTDDGATRVYISLGERRDPSVAFCVNGTATINWGDGTTPDEVTGSDLTTLIYTSHTYANAGDYIISISTEDEITIKGVNQYSTLLTRGSGTHGPTSSVYYSSVSKIELGANVNLADGAFGYLWAKSVSFPSSITITSAYYGMFYGSDHLEAVVLPINLTTLLDSTFYICRKLKRLAVAPGITTIQSNVFNGCSSLGSVTIGGGVTTIYQSAFSGLCGDLIIGDSNSTVTQSGSSGPMAGFLGTSAILPNKWSSLSYLSCQNSSFLKSFRIPDNSASTGAAGMFNNCYSLEYLEIPAKCTGFNNTFISSCYSLKKIKFERDTPPYIPANSFASLPTDCVILVPSGKLDTYKAASNYPDPNVYTYEEY